MSAHRTAVASAICFLPLCISGWLLPPAAAADPKSSLASNSQPQPIDDDLIDREAAKIDFQAVFAAGMSGGSFAPTNRLEQILADSSVSKISGHVVRMPAAEASARVQRLFDRLLLTHKKGFEQCMARLRGDEASKGVIPITDNAHALSATLFLCALHCDRAAFLKKLDAWQVTMGPLIAECMRDSKLTNFRMQASMDGLPQQALILNLYVIVLDRDAKFDSLAIERRFGRVLPHFRSAAVSFGDMGTDWSVVAQTPDGENRDNRKMVSTVKVAQSWMLPIVVDGASKADEILAAMRTQVDNIGKPAF